MTGGTAFRLPDSILPSLLSSARSSFRLKNIVASLQWI
jgi:hypothetical protein